MSRAVGRTLERIILTVSPGEVRSQLGETIQRTLNNHRRVFVIEQQRWMSDQQTQERSLDVVAAEGTPTLRKGRKAIIYAPARTPMQSGSAQTLEGACWGIIKGKGMVSSSTPGLVSCLESPCAQCSAVP